MTEIIQRKEKKGPLAVVVPFFDCVGDERRLLSGIQAIEPLEQCPDVWVSETLVKQPERMADHTSANCIIDRKSVV